jgi:hypothetical protein
MKKVRTRVLSAVAVYLLFHCNAVYSQDCDSVIKGGVFNSTLINYSTSSQSSFKDFQCSSDFQSRDEATNAGISIAVPIYGVPFELGGTFSESTKEIWKRANCSQSQRSTSFREARHTLIQFASSEILSAWQNCNNRIGLKCTLQNRDDKVVIFNAIWNPAHGDNGSAPEVVDSLITGGSRKSIPTSETSIPISPGPASWEDDDTTTANAPFTSISVFRVGSFIKHGQGDSVQIERDGKSTVIVTLNTKRGSCDAVAKAPVPPPPPPREPVYETKWFKADESGREYSQTFSHGSANRHNMGGQNASGQYSLSDSSGRIYRVDFRCSGDFCPWNYNPTGGYGGNTTIIDGGRGFIWKRLWDGKPATEFYTAFYEVQRRVCVRNCYPRFGP